MPTITLSATLGGSKVVEAKDATPDQLYDGLDFWVSHRSYEGRGRDEGAAQFRAVANKEIAKIKRELRKRKLPVWRWRYEAELREQDAQDEAADWDRRQRGR